MEKARSSFYSKIKTPNLLKQRSWSFQTSSPCFIVFTLFLLPKSPAWTRCLWRAKAMRLPLGFLLCPVSPVIHRPLNSNTPPDRGCSPRTLSEKDAALESWLWPKMVDRRIKKHSNKDIMVDNCIQRLNKRPLWEWYTWYMEDVSDFWTNCGPTNLYFTKRLWTQHVQL